LPRDVLYRRKQGFSIPLALWFRRGFGDDFSHALAKRRDELTEYFNMNEVESMLARHRKGTRDFSRPLWLLWMFSGFMERRSISH